MVGVRPPVFVRFPVYSTGVIPGFPFVEGLGFGPRRKTGGSGDVWFSSSWKMIKVGLPLGGVFLGRVNIIILATTGAPSRPITANENMDLLAEVDTSSSHGGYFTKK